MNIVVIDDDKLVALSLKTILESTGNITVSATTANTVRTFCSWISAWRA